MDRLAAGLPGSGLGMEPGMRESRASAGLEARLRITGSEMFAKAFCVLSRAAAAKEMIPLEVRC